VIQIRNLSKSFDGKPVLRKIDLDIEEHKTLVILGPSGQGKTVFIKAMVRLIEPDSGSVAFDGRNIFPMSVREFREIRKRIAFVFQDNALFDFLNVGENLSLFLRMHTSLPPEKIQEKVGKVLSFVGFDEEVSEKFPEELSGGMSKRVAIARAMLQRPRIIFYDEPTVGLDGGNVAKVIDLIAQLKKQVCATSVIVTHDIALMHAVSDRVALLKEGRIVFTGDKLQITDTALKELYSGETT
jgi:phospholipid/cholesterol/gamma-HCH transport system ATP-binding protein